MKVILWLTLITGWPQPSSCNPPFYSVYCFSPPKQVTEQLLFDNMAECQKNAVAFRKVPRIVKAECQEEKP